VVSSGRPLMDSGSSVRRGFGRGGGRGCDAPGF
jgi:hypothetical protein